MLTKDQFQKATKCSDKAAEDWVGPINNAIRAFDINTPGRVAPFLAQMAHESQRFSVFTENLNYSDIGLARTWPNRYAVNPNAIPLKSNLLAQELHRNPEKIANVTYAGRMGNGLASSGDGWKYRGRGPKQITGRNNYKACGIALGINLLDDPDQLLDPTYGAYSAGWYWNSRNCNFYADNNDYTEITRVINGGLIGYDLRVAAWDNAKAALSQA